MTLKNNDLTLFVAASAQERIIEVLSEYQARALRVFVQGGGCSGFSYGFDVAKDFSYDDFVVESDDRKVSIVVDAMSAMYLNEATVRFEDSMWSRRFLIDNPNVKHSCGCGSSFAL